MRQRSVEMFDWFLTNVLPIHFGIRQLKRNERATLEDGRVVVGPRSLVFCRYENLKPQYKLATADEVEMDAEDQIW